MCVKHRQLSYSKWSHCPTAHYAAPHPPVVHTLKFYFSRHFSTLLSVRAVEPGGRSPEHGLSQGVRLADHSAGELLPGRHRHRPLRLKHFSWLSPPFSQEMCVRPAARGSYFHHAPRNPANSTRGFPKACNIRKMLSCCKLPRAGVLEGPNLPSPAPGTSC